MARQARSPTIITLNGVYYVRWRDEAAKRERRKSLNTRDALEAAALFAAWLQETAGGKVTDGASRPQGPRRIGR